MPQSTRRIGVIGTSRITALHLSALREIAGVSLIGITGSSAETLRVLSETAGAAAVPSVSELLDLQPDVLVLTGTLSRRNEVLPQAIGRVSQIISEKPLASTLRECHSYFEKGRAAKTRIDVVNQWRFHPDVARLLRMGKARPGSLSLSIEWNSPRELNYLADANHDLRYLSLPQSLEIALYLFDSDLRLKEAELERQDGVIVRIALRALSSRGSVSIRLDSTVPREHPFRCDLESGGRSFRTSGYFSDTFWNRLIARQPNHLLAMKNMYREFLFSSENQDETWKRNARLSELLEEISNSPYTKRTLPLSAC